MRSLKNNVLVLSLVIFLVLSVLFLFSKEVSANVIILEPVNYSIQELNYTNIIINTSIYNVSNVTFYYKTNSSYSLIGYNSTQGLSEYNIYNISWNITERLDDLYTIKVNVSNSSIWNASYIRIYIDKMYPNITYINFSNSNLENRRIFENNSEIDLQIILNETNNTVNSVIASTNQLINNSFSWNSTLNKWILRFNITGNLDKNNLTIFLKDVSNKTTIRKYSYYIDLEYPSSSMKFYSLSAYDPFRVNYKGISNLLWADKTKDIIAYNSTDDINITYSELYLDDVLINSSYSEEKFNFFNNTINPIVGKHNITIIANDIFNKTKKNTTFVYWWFGSSDSNTSIVNWENYSNQENQEIDTVHLTMKLFDMYDYTNISNRNTCYSITCGILFKNDNNYSVEYLDLVSDATKRTLLEINFNKTPYIHINNLTQNARDIIENIEYYHSTNVSEIIIVNESNSKTKFIEDNDIYFGRITFPVNFSNSTQFDNILYYKENISNYKTITRDNFCRNDILTEYFNKSSTEPCYLVENGNTIIYVPNQGIVSINKDNYPPRINRTFPIEEHNNSIDLKIEFETSEDAICNLTLYNETIQFNISNIDLTGQDNYSQYFFYDFEDTYFKDDIYNLTIKCKDSKNNVRISEQNITVEDIVSPEIDIITPTAITYTTTSANTYNISIEIETNELCNISYSINSMTYTKIAENSLTAQTSTYKATGTYTLSIYAKDISGNTNTKTVTFSVNAQISQSTSSESTTSVSSSGIVIQANTTSNSKIDVQQWYNLKQDIKTEMMMDNIYFDLTKISFIPKKNISNLKLEVELKEEYPIKIPDNKKVVYQYYSIKELYGSSKIVNPEIIFRVKKSWIKENNVEKIILSRYHDSWSEIIPVKLGEDSVYETYRAISPGFSYFVITGIPYEPVIEKPTIIRNTTIIPNNNNNSLDIKIENRTDDLSKNNVKNKTNYSSIIFSILIVIGIMGSLLLLLNTITLPILKYSDLTTDEKKRLREFISAKLSTGESMRKIESELIEVGWSQDVISKIMMTVDIPVVKEKELEDFIEKMMKLRNITKDDLKKSLLKVGWQEEIVEKLLRKY